MKNSITDLFKQEIETFELTTIPTSFSHTVTLDEEFKEPRQFSELVNALEQANEGDVFQIRLASPGGALHSIYPLLAAMRNTEGFIHIHVDSDIASASTLLLMQAHMVTFNEYVSIMFHHVNYAAFGHGGNVEAQSVHFTKTHEKLIRDSYKDFLNDDEIQLLMFGQEIWMTPEQCIERLKARAEKNKQECNCGDEECITQFLEETGE